MIRILVVDDYPIVREGLIAVFENQSDLEVVGAAATAEEALDLTASLKPDVILLDLGLPGGLNGSDAIPFLLQAAPEAKIVVFTAYDADEQIFRTIKFGAKGYLLKGDAPNEEIIRAVRVVSQGGTFLEPQIAARLLEEMESPKRAAQKLSDREMEILKLVADGLPNKQIAYALGISERTVKFHLTSIFTKLEAENRAQAVALATQRGIIL